MSAMRSRRFVITLNGELKFSPDDAYSQISNDAHDSMLTTITLAFHKQIKTVSSSHYPVAGNIEQAIRSFGSCSRGTG